MTTTITPAVVAENLGHMADFIRAARKTARSSASVYVEIVEGAAAPTLVGEGAYATTKGGTPIDTPNAYAKKGWSSMIRHASTRRVVVGANWRPTDW